MTINPIVLEAISGLGVFLKTQSEIKNYKKSSNVVLLTHMKKYWLICDPLEEADYTTINLHLYVFFS